MDNLSHLEVDILKVKEGGGEEEESLTLQSGSENNSMNIIKWTITMHTNLIFKEQTKVKESGLRDKVLAQPHNSIQHMER
jgi:hypothetical protein